MNLFALLGIFFLAADPSYSQAGWFALLKSATTGPIYAVYALHILTAYLRAKGGLSFLGDNSMDLVFFAPMLALTFGGVHPGHVLTVRQFIHYFSRYLQSNTLSNFAQSISERPARLFAMSFAGVIMVGTFLLVLPVSVNPQQQTSFLTALFTSTSAVCVTGLIVVDTPTYFTLFGQVVILLLIQVGGLGIMTLSAGVAFLIGKRFGISERSVLQNVLDATDLVALRQTLKDILKWTLLIESAGAFILTLRFYLVLDWSPWKALYFGVFHAVSAFCNAGFALFTDSLMQFTADPIINLTIMGLIVLGGLGFTVLSALNGFLLGDRRLSRDVHSVMVLFLTGFLILLGTAVIYSLELTGPSMQNLATWEKLLAASFQSVTARTAGFNTIDFGIMTDGALFFIIILMFIGASPGSTGGGIKTTTVGTMALALDSQMRGLPEVVLMERTIPSETVMKAFLITALSASLVAFCTFILILTESQPLLKLSFEVVSAFATVGLSTGITAALSPLGKLVLVFLMYLGRIGPLTWALSIRTSHDAANVRYPSARILVG